MVNTATSIQSDGVIPAFPPIHRFTTLESLSVKCTYAQYQGNNNLLARMIAALLQANPGLKSLSIDHHGHSGDRSALYTLNNLFARKLEAQDEAEDDILKAIAGIDLGVTSGAEQLPLLPTGDLGAGESPLKYSIGLSLERLAIGTDLIDAQVSIDVIRRIRNLREFLTPIDTFRHGRLEQHQNLQNFWRVLERNRIALVTFQNDDIGHGCMDYLLSTTGQQSLAFTDPPSYPPSLRDSSVNWHPGFKSIHLHNLSSTNSQPRLESADSTEYGATFFTKILPHHSATLTKLILHCATPCSWCYEKKYLEILSQVRGLETLGLTVIWDVTALDDSEQKSTLFSLISLAPLLRHLQSLTIYKVQASVTSPAATRSPYRFGQGPPIVLGRESLDRQLEGALGFYTPPNGPGHRAWDGHLSEITVNGRVYKLQKLTGNMVTGKILPSSLAVMWGYRLKHVLVDFGAIQF